MCYHSKNDTHFPHGCANPQRADRNGQKDNEWKKGENRCHCFLKTLEMVYNSSDWINRDSEHEIKLLNNTCISCNLWTCVL